jgi:hypothetical protein
MHMSRNRAAHLTNSDGLIGAVKSGAGVATWQVLTTANVLGMKPSNNLSWDKNQRKKFDITYFTALMHLSAQRN